MRRILVATSMLSLLLLPAAALASQPQTDASASQNLRVSTGVVAPTVVDSVAVAPPTSALADAIPMPAEVGLLVNVSATGQAQTIQVVKSLTPEWDARVIDAVRQFHFRPASLDNQPIAATMRLTVNIAR